VKVFVSIDHNNAKGQLGAPKLLYKLSTLLAVILAFKFNSI